MGFQFKILYVSKHDTIGIASLPTDIGVV